jgi:transposase InsO family protein
MDGRGRCHDNIFVERLWWTVKHEWVYLRPAANGIEQKRSLAEFFDWYNLRRRIRRWLASKIASLHPPTLMLSILFRSF